MPENGSMQSPCLGCKRQPVYGKHQRRVCRYRRKCKDLSDFQEKLLNNIQTGSGVINMDTLYSFSF